MLGLGPRNSGMRDRERDRPASWLRRKSGQPPTQASASLRALLGRAAAIAVPDLTPYAAPNERRETRILLLIVWTATVISYLVASIGDRAAFSTDDAMRLVQVRDFLAGQSWFDLTQYRLNPPDGVVTHWSRLIDLPIALLVRGGQWLVPAWSAEALAAVIWPAGLLLVFFAGVACLAREFAGEAAARLALVFAALMAPVLQHFRPGAIDHHNAQLALLIWTLVLAARAAPRWGADGRHNPVQDAALAGALSALSLGIGLEMAPALAALAGAWALQWVLRGQPVRAGAAAFALAQAAGVAAAFLVTIPPAHYGLAACDALSVVHVLAAGAGGIGLAVLTAMPGLTTRNRRLAALGGLGVALSALLVLGFPACLADPYAHLDPRLAALWLANVSEARSVVSLLRDLPQEVLPYYGLPAAALALGLWQVRQDEAHRGAWVKLVCVLAMLCLVALWEVRGAAAANAVAAALVTGALVRLFPAPEGRAVFVGVGRAALIAACLVNPLALIALGQLTARAVEVAGASPPPTIVADGPGTCRRASDYTPLANLPPGLVLAFIDAGPFLLMETPHSVLAAPYHRDVGGNAAMLDIFLAEPADAQRRIASLGIRYVAFCPGAPERYNYAQAAPDGLAALLARGEVPAFLKRINLDGTDVAVYRPAE
jgi:hypothetical protein